MKSLTSQSAMAAVAGVVRAVAGDTMFPTKDCNRKEYEDTSGKPLPAWALSAAFVAVASLAWTGLPNAAVAQPSAITPPQQVEEKMKIRMTMEGAEIMATLDDNKTTRDFISLLPTTLTLEDYNKTEKVSDLPKRLSTEGAPEGIDPSVGDITYYAPWGNLALFYRDFGYARGLVRLGRIESGIDVLKRPGPLTVTIERAK
jgi:hypothetical protein